MLRIKVGNKMVGLKQLAPDDIGSLRRTKSSEMSTFVQCNNHAHSIHNKKRVDLWFKEQNINVGKLGRGQQVMYQQLLRVHNEKRRNRKKKYIHQQELVRQQLREKAAGERQQTALELNGLSEGKSAFPEVLSDIGEEDELNFEVFSQEKVDKKWVEGAVDETSVKTANDSDRSNEKQDASKGTTSLKTPTEKRTKPKKSKRKIGISQLPDELQTSSLDKMKKDDSEVTDDYKPAKLAENPQAGRKGQKPGANGTQQQDDFINTVSGEKKDPMKTGLDGNERKKTEKRVEEPFGESKDPMKTGLDGNERKRREKRVEEPFGLLPRVSLTTSYLTHGSPRASDDESNDHTQAEKPNGKTRRSSRKKRGSEITQEAARNSADKLPGIASQETRNSAGKLPEIVSSRSSEAPNTKDSLTTLVRKARTDKMVDITRFHRFTRSVRIPSNVYIPRVSRVVRYHRNTKGSLVSSEVTLKPVEEDFKLPSTKEAYFVKKALDKEKEKAREHDRKLQDFYAKMEQIPSHISVMARPIPSPTKEIFRGDQNKLGFSASILTHMRHSSIDGDVHDLKNCKYIRFHDILSPEQRELHRRMRRSSWGNHSTTEPISWKAAASRRELSSNAKTY